MPATVTVRTTAKPAAAGGRHPKLVLANSKGQRVEVPHAPIEGALSKLGAAWEEVARQGNRAPLLIHAGPQLATTSLELDLVDTRHPDRSVELYIFALTILARSDSPVWISNYGNLVGNAWRITDLSAVPYRREHGTNAIAAAMVTLELTAASDLRIVVARNRPAVAGTTTGPAYTVRTYTIVAGDTPASLALRFYGSADAIAYLLELNNLRDPRQLVAGLTIKVPG